MTGGAAGIGLATTQILLNQGWGVTIVDLDGKAIAAASELLAACSGRLHFLQADVTNEAQMAQAVAETGEKLGPLRGIVTSAGIGKDVPLFETSADLFRRMFEVNVVGTFLLCKAAAAVMKETGGGAIVTLASVSGLTGNIGRSAYGASKGAIVNLTRIMAVELARYGIRVNSVAPGPVETAMVSAVHAPHMRAIWEEQLLLGRYGTPAEIGEAAAFLLDEARSSYITGQVLAVDGGFTAAKVIDRGRG